MDGEIAARLRAKSYLEDLPLPAQVRVLAMTATVSKLDHLFKTSCTKVREDVYSCGRDVIVALVTDKAKAKAILRGRTGKQTFGAVDPSATSWLGRRTKSVKSETCPHVVIGEGAWAEEAVDKHHIPIVHPDAGPAVLEETVKRAIVGRAIVDMKDKARREGEAAAGAAADRRVQEAYRQGWIDGWNEHNECNPFVAGDRRANCEPEGEARR